MTTSTLGVDQQGNADGRQIPRRRFRTDIQALRALAVGLVVLNHLWPSRLPGGYVGVDVFFVISGFLISSHLLRELNATGRVRLVSFYARRARRLFPAAFLVLGVSAALAVLFLPYPRWLATAKEIVASVFYVENWLLAAQSVDYSAASASASAVQHYWSLSVEEQFYLLWPLTLVLFALIARRLRRDVRSMVAVGVCGVAAVSLACSIYVTAVWPQQAYFATPVRVWEFAAGALVALLAAPMKSIILRQLLAVAGFGFILASAAVFDGSTPFPGWTALLPVIGTTMVIAAGIGQQSVFYERVTALPPIQFIGKISYSLYLWHWPLIVAAPFVFGTVPTTPYKLVILAVSVILAWLTKKWVEDRWIKESGRRTKAKNWNGFKGPVLGMLSLTIVASLLGGYGIAKEEQTAELAAAGAAGPCHGAAAITNKACGDPFATPVAIADMGKENEYWVTPDECRPAEGQLVDGGIPASCDFSRADSNAEVVWLVGDSHAQQWQEAILTLGRERGWLVKLAFQGACPLVDAPLSSFNGSAISAQESQECRTWGQSVTKAIEEDKPDRVFVSTFAAREGIDDGTGRPQLEQYVDGLGRYWARWAAEGITVMPIHDAPLNAGSGRPPECLSLNPSTPSSCAVPKDVAIEFDPFGLAVERMDHDSVVSVNLEDYFCDASSCYSAVGGVSVYYDADHLNRQFVATLAPRIGELL